MAGSVITGPFNRAAVIAKSDTVNIPTGPTDAIYVGTKGSTGTVMVIFENDQSAIFVGVAAGTILPVRAKRVQSATTDASDMLALYVV